VSTTIQEAPLVPGLPLVGSLPQMIANFPKMLLETAPSFGDVVRLNIAGTTMMVVSHPEMLEYILRDNHHNYVHGEMAAGQIGRVTPRGLFMLEGQEWLLERRMMQPYFHRKYLGRIMELLDETIVEQMDKLERESSEGVIDLANAVKRITISVFLRAIFSMGMDEAQMNKIGEAFDIAMRGTARRNKIGYIVPRSVRLPLDRKIDDALKYLGEVVTGIIRDRRESGQQGDDMMGMLLAAHDDETGARLSDESLLDEVKTLILGGYDTTSGSLLWATHLLSHHPAVTERLVRESREVLSTGRVGYENYNDLHYARWVFNETMRQKPVAWAIPRESIAEDVLGGYRIPAKTTIMIPVVHIHHDARWWDQPEKFMPERWEDKFGGAKHRFAYLPFGMGPRVCLGEQFAVTEGTLLLARLFERFEIEPLSPTAQQVDYNFTMAPQSMPVRIRRREASLTPA
jgi:cytochrome P450